MRLGSIYTMVADKSDLISGGPGRGEGQTLEMVGWSVHHTEVR